MTLRESILGAWQLVFAVDEETSGRAERRDAVGVLHRAGNPEMEEE
jgi:hypothetical protein